MLHFGQLHKYQASQESISAYLELVDVFFLASDIPEEKQVTVFLSIVRARTYALLRDLLAPQKPQEKSLQDLFATLKMHYEPRPLVIEQQFHFNHRDQKSLESIAKYVTELRKATFFCEFGDFLDAALWDRFVCGLHNELMLKRLLTEESLTLAKAIDIAQGLEAADRSVKHLHNHKDDLVGHVRTDRMERTRRKGQAGAPKPCYRCAESGHLPSACHFRGSECRRCGKRGHIAHACRSEWS